MSLYLLHVPLPITCPFTYYMSLYLLHVPLPITCPFTYYMSLYLLLFLPNTFGRTNT